MGYTTEFTGKIAVVPALNAEEIQYLKAFNKTRRMKRGKGPYYVGSTENYGQNREADIIEYNEPPKGQPGLWCKWAPTEDGESIVWDGAEKFYDPVEWMQYLIDHFIGSSPIAKDEHPEEFSFLQGHVLNGGIEAQGEESDDRWKLVVKDNAIRRVQGHFVFDE